MKTIDKCEGVKEPDLHGAIGVENGETTPDDFWSGPVDTLLVHLATTATGLKTSESQSRLATYGPNDAAIDKEAPLWLRFLAASAIHSSSSRFSQADYPRRLVT
jgi:magnesium-transporting ATPase (P-type)